MTLKNDHCEIEVNADTLRPRYANCYYFVKLLSGTWPTDHELILVCDNNRFGGPNATFGGNVESRGINEKYVTVHVD